MRDASGQMYMRNRYYDPKTGQFTQTDPIGLAGGLNAYEFANGDPVTYSDPYGLKADDGCDPPGSCFVKRAMQGTAVGLAGGLAVAGACTLGTAGVCALGPAEATVVVSTAAGSAAGVIVGAGEELVAVGEDAVHAVSESRVGRWAKRVLAGVMLGGSVGTTVVDTPGTASTDSRRGDASEPSGETRSQGRRGPRKEQEQQEPS